MIQTGVARRKGNTKEWLASDEGKAHMKLVRKDVRDNNKKRRASMSPEQIEEEKSNKAYDKRKRLEDKEDKIRQKAQMINNQRELAILNFMLKTDVKFYHHGRSDSMVKEIEKQIDSFKIKEQEIIVVVSGKQRTGKPKKNAIDPNASHMEYNNYVWNRYGEGNNCMSKSLLGMLWRQGETPFETIYDVPLDGTYTFYGYDSGERGCGSFDRMTVLKVDEVVKVPFVDPGAIVGITAN